MEWEDLSLYWNLYSYFTSASIVGQTVWQTSGSSMFHHSSGERLTLIFVYSYTEQESLEWKYSLLGNRVYGSLRIATCHDHIMMQRSHSKLLYDFVVFWFLSDGGHTIRVKLCKFHIVSKLKVIILITFLRDIVFSTRDINTSLTKYYKNIRRGLKIQYLIE